MSTIKISIISDPVCPWCYIGYRRLNKAIRLYQKTYPGGSKDTFEIDWRPYILKPNATSETTQMHESVVSRMGEQRGTKALEHMMSVGNAEGITFNFKAGRIGSSLLAHRLLYYVGKTGTPETQTLMAETLFYALFEEAKDITNIEVLVHAAASIGQDAAEIKAWLESNEGKGEVKKESERIKSSGVKGVPNYVFGETTLDGAIDTSEFFELFIGLKEKK